MGHAALMGDDLLCPQSQPGSLLGWQGQRFVKSICVKALSPAKYSSQGFNGHPCQVELRLLGGERCPGCLGVESELSGVGVAGSVAVLHPPGSDAPGCAVVGDLF